jgi:hypothetical protein
MEEKFRKSRKEKPYVVIRTEKKIFSRTEDKLIAGIPVIVRIRPIAIEPLPVSIAIEVEHVRVAIRISYA